MHKMEKQYTESQIQNALNLEILLSMEDRLSDIIRYIKIGLFETAYAKLTSLQDEIGDRLDSYFHQNGDRLLPLEQESSM